MLVRRVIGRSMAPALIEGDVIIARRLQRVREGDVVVARMAGREVIKRVHRSDGNRFHLRGDNATESTDSRTLGPVDVSDILGVSIMKLRFATETPAPAPTRKGLLWVPYGLALLTSAMLLGQLLSFEEFIRVLGDYFVPGGLTSAKVLAVVIVVAELFALPFWLRMRLSQAMRVVSLFSGFIFMIVWTLLGIWAFANGLQLENCGCFGAFLPQPFSGWVLLQDAIVLGAIVLSAYVLNARRVLAPKR